MDRASWVAEFSIALQELRPYLSTKVASVIGLQLYRANLEPAEAARIYHQQAAPPARKGPKR